MIVAIDGPSGAGKSTVAKAAAKRLGFSCLDTGAMYRAIAWKALADGVSFDDAEALGAIARDNEIEFGHVEGDPVPRRVFISGTMPSARPKSTAPWVQLPPFPQFARRLSPNSSASVARATTWSRAATSARSFSPRHP